MKIVIYVCINNESKTALKNQLKACYEFAKSSNYTVVGEYIDRTSSRRSDDCPEFQRMIADSATKQFQGVLIYHNHFALTQYDNESYKSKLKKTGINVISACEKVSDDASRMLLDSLLASMKKYYSEELSVKIKRSKKENALKCKANGGIVPFGYLVNSNKNYEVDPLSAPFALEIFTRYSEGQSVGTIIKEINRYIIVYTKSKDSIYNLLKNRKYIGEYRYGDIVIPNGMPAIVPKDIFNTVQMRMKNNKQKCG